MQKTRPFRSAAYKAWVKSLPCCNCAAPADDPHHIKGVGNLSGAGLAAPDTYLMPMCRGCHSWIHTTPEAWPMQWEWIARTLAKAVDEGFNFAGG